MSFHAISTRMYSRFMILFTSYVAFFTLLRSNGQDTDFGNNIAPGFEEMNISTTNTIMNQTTDKLIYTLQQQYQNDSAVTFSWSFDVSGFNIGQEKEFAIELAPGEYNQDFVEIGQVYVNNPASYNGSILTYAYTVYNLSPASKYLVRVVPVYQAYRGYPSNILLLQTLPSPMNYWEPIISRRTSLSGYGRGFTDPVADRPHLTAGAEINTQHTSDNPIWQSDSPTMTTPYLPTGRRGHSMTVIDGAVYMFGGRTNGYVCASTLKDTLDLGNSYAGREIYPCVSMQSEVHEIWKLDINTFEWQFVNTTADVPGSTLPPAREQHSAGVVQGDLYIFGGKSRLHAVSSTGFPILTNKTDQVYNDLWKLKIEHAQQYNFSHTSTMPIPQNGRLLIPITPTNPVNYPNNEPRDGLCIRNLTVKVHLSHPCVSQLRIGLQGPGSLTGSPNYFTSSQDFEVTLLTSIATFNNTHCPGGDYTFVFNDAFTKRLQDCCHDSLSGNIQPTGQLKEFLGSTMASTWSLVIEDYVSDGSAGDLLSWELDFTMSPCVPKYSWTNLTTPLSSHLTIPPARYGALTMSYGSYLFIYGGRDHADYPLHDLYRYNIQTNHWTALQPVQWTDMLATTPSMSVGSNFVLTAWGLLRFGGLFRSASLASKSAKDPRSFRTPLSTQSLSEYDNTFMVLDPVTLHWQSMNVTAFSQRYSAGGSDVYPQQETSWYTDPISAPKSDHNGTNSNTNTPKAKGTLLQAKIAFPTGRYLSHLVFLPAHLFSWSSASFPKQQLSDQQLFGEAYRTSYQANYQNTVADSVLLFGGFDGAAGTMVDGSSGGYLQDVWLLRLNDWSTRQTRAQQVAYQDRHCRWRKNTSAQSAGLLNCIASTATSATTCGFRDLLMLMWCDNFNQTLI